MFFCADFKIDLGQFFRLRFKRDRRLDSKPTRVRFFILSWSEKTKSSNYVLVPYETEEYLISAREHLISPERVDFTRRNAPSARGSRLTFRNLISTLITVGFEATPYLRQFVGDGELVLRVDVGDDLAQGRLGLEN